MTKPIAEDVIARTPLDAEGLHIASTTLRDFFTNQRARAFADQIEPAESMVFYWDRVGYAIERLIATAKGAR